MLSGLLKSYDFPTLLNIKNSAFPKKTSKNINAYMTLVE